MAAKNSSLTFENEELLYMHKKVLSISDGMILTQNARERTFEKSKNKTPN